MSECNFLRVNFECCASNYDGISPCVQILYVSRFFHAARRIN